MYQIRHGVFETNSSSTHSVSVYLQHDMMMCSKSDYDAWKNGDIYLNKSSFSNEKFMTKEEAMKLYLERNDTFEEWLKTNNIITFDGYTNEKNLRYHDANEEFVEEFETSGGETVVCFGYCYADGDCEEEWY